MFFVLGDSHARSLHGKGNEDPHEIIRPNGRTWRVLGTGGATAGGLLNEDSVTRAGHRSREYLDLFMSSDKKVVFLMFGDVDCVDHDPTVRQFHRSSDRFRQFAAQVSLMRGVAGVFCCKVYPRTRNFAVGGRTADEIQRTIVLWNSLLGTSVDTFSPLRDVDNFLRHDLCHNDGTDPEERHLSPPGNELVWQALEEFCLRIPCAF